MATGSVDAGHGGSDPGAVASGVVREAGITLSVASKLTGALRVQGHNIFETRTEDVSVGLDERIAIWTPHDLDFVISVHCNSFTTIEARGHEVWYQHGDSSSVALAAEVNREIANTWGGDLPNRGLKAGSPETRTNWYTFQGGKQADILVELAFLSNPLDFELLKPELHHVWAGAIADGVKAYLNVQPDEEEIALRPTDYDKMLNRQSVNERLIQYLQALEAGMPVAMKDKFHWIRDEYFRVVNNEADTIRLDKPED
jgi:N-acetylmuramoyl-L-alanine amidase